LSFIQRHFRASENDAHQRRDGFQFVSLRTLSTRSSDLAEFGRSAQQIILPGQKNHQASQPTRADAKLAASSQAFAS
jgi:hypothetical protein